MRFISIDEVKKMMSHGEVFVKTVCSPIGNDYSWEKLLDQISNPEKNRGTQQLDDTIDRNEVYNPKLGQWEYRNFTDKPRGAFKPSALYTKKTSVSLPPKDGIMHFFQSADSRYPANLAIILNMKKCNIYDEKYVFDHDINAHTRWWLKRKGLAKKKHNVTRSLPLVKLREDLEVQRKRGIIPQHNDILVGISKEALAGVLILENTIENRLNAIAKKELIKKYLNCDVPLLIQDLNAGPKEYTLEQQYSDIRKAIKSDPSKSPVLLVTQFISSEYVNSALSSQNITSIAKNIEDLPRELWPEISQFLSPDSVRVIQENFSSEKRNHAFLPAIKNLIDQIQKILKQIDPNYKIQNNNGAIEQYKEIIRENANTILLAITEDIAGDSYDYKLNRIQLLIEHAYFVEDPVLSDALKIMLRREYMYDAVPLITLLMERNRGFPILQQSKLIGYEHQTGWMYNHYIKNEVIVNCWSLMVSGMLYHNPQKMAPLIAKYFPQYVAQTINALSQIQEKLSNRNVECYYKLETVMNCRLYLLLYMNKNFKYKVSKNDKELLRNYFLKKINTTQSVEELNAIRKDFEMCRSVRQRRHPIADNVYQFFLNKPKPIATVELIESLIHQKNVSLLSP